MSRPQFRSIREQVAELAAFAASHTPEEVRQKIDQLPPGVRRKVLDAASHGAFSWAEHHGKHGQGCFELGEDGWATSTERTP